jgi:Lamin Tail Domain
MNPHSAFVAAAFCFILNSQTTTLVSASVIISEIAAKGSSNVCSSDDANNDWIELHNNDLSEPVSLAGFILHDEKGIHDVNAFAFPPDYEPLLPGEYRLICTNMTGVSPQFSIGGDDTITLVSSDGSTVIASVGALPYTTHNATHLPPVALSDQPK